MSELIPCLSHDGNCAEALRCDEPVLGGKIVRRVRGADMPMAAQIPKEHAERIMHGRFSLAHGGLLDAGDCPPHGVYQGIQGVGVTLDFETVEQASRAFNGLADGGKVTMPLQPMFWAKIAGMVTNRFGAPGIVNGELASVRVQQRSRGRRWPTCC